MEGHPRLAEAVAQLAIGAEWGVAFAASLGVIGTDEARQIFSDAWRVLLSLASGHGRDLKEESPTALFLRTIQEALEAGHIHLASIGSETVVAGDARGKKVGWLDAQYAYLLPTETFKFVTEHLKYRGGLPLGDREIKRLLIKEGAMPPIDESKPSSAKSPTKWTGKSSSRVMFIKREYIWPSKNDGLSYSFPDTHYTGK